ncbi:hypothetical protein C8R44DRAFT_812328 [Mycena epipterygia]|nr:hypothetical protein C8R44DRAFT_812328 [Mycena epipterygia]
MGPPSKLAQELIDYIIINFLHDSPEDWRACALVSRSWVYAAQAHIFRHIPFSVDDRLSARFLATVDASPHLIRHIRRVDVDLGLSPETCIALCNLPFTHLERVDLAFARPTPPCTLAVQQLLSLPTLCRPCIIGDDVEAHAFSQIWARCSATLKHLELYIWRFPKNFSPRNHPRSPLRLESLNVRDRIDVDLRGWLTHPDCPFDFSDLRHVSIDTNTELLVSQKFRSAFQTIQTLDLMCYYTIPTLDMSLLPRLAVLRIGLYSPSWSWVLSTIATIAPSNLSLTTLIFCVFITIPSAQLAQLDLQLSGLPIPLTVELEMQPVPYARMSPSLPLLGAKNTLRRADYDPYWFQHLTSMV